MKKGYVIVHKFSWNKDVSFLMCYPTLKSTGWVGKENAHVFRTKTLAEKAIGIVRAGYAKKHKMSEKEFSIREWQGKEYPPPFDGKQEEERREIKTPQEGIEECFRQIREGRIEGAKAEKEALLRDGPEWFLTGFFNYDRLLSRRSDDQFVKNLLALGRKIADKGEVDRVRFTNDAFHGQYLDQEEYRFKDNLPCFLNRAMLGDTKEMLDILGKIAVRFERALADLGMSFGHDYSLIKTEARSWRAMEEKLQADFDTCIAVEKLLATYDNGISPLSPAVCLSCLGEGLEHPENIVYKIQYAA